MSELKEDFNLMKEIHKERVGKTPDRIKYAEEQFKKYGIKYALKNPSTGHFHCWKKDGTLIQFYASTGKIQGYNNIRGIGACIKLVTKESKEGKPTDLIKRSDAMMALTGKFDKDFTFEEYFKSTKNKLQNMSAVKAVSHGAVKAALKNISQHSFEASDGMDYVQMEVVTTELSRLLGEVNNGKVQTNTNRRTVNRGKGRIRTKVQN